LTVNSLLVVGVISLLYRKIPVIVVIPAACVASSIDNVVACVLLGYSAVLRRLARLIIWSTSAVLPVMLPLEMNATMSRMDKLIAGTLHLAAVTDRWQLYMLNVHRVPIKSGTPSSYR